MRAYGYVRVSSEEQLDSGLSIENQQQKIEAYCKAMDLELVAGAVDQASGKNMSRTGLLKMFELARKKEIDCVVILKLDRLTRSVNDTFDITERLDKLGVGLHSVQEKLDTKSATGRFYITILAALAEMERRQVGERTAAALAIKKSKGEIVGTLSYGYHRKGKSKMLEEDVTEQRYMDEVLEMANSGLTYEEIAESMNARGATTRKGNRWYSSNAFRVHRYALEREQKRNSANITEITTPVI